MSAASMGEHHLSEEVRTRAAELVALYPHPRSALIPICHLAQEQDGWLRPEAIAEIAQIVGVTPAEVLGTASFYDMLHTEPVGRYLVAVCTNIACMLKGAYELLEHAEEHLGVRVGATTADAMFTLEDAECLADCGRAPCLQVNHRFFGDVSPEAFDALVEDLRAGRLDDEVPHHGTLVRVRRQGGLRVDAGTVAAERETARVAMAERARVAEAADPGANEKRSGS
ncbi:MAG TPA: NAD(P)H-dependent oxidoreductase subunit E [Acidimicrobiales bacterium]|nr:NAD(P)H-dependent oxidoreductase subunit E [Acidimicrobiales bacterium]